MARVMSVPNYPRVAKPKESPQAKGRFRAVHLIPWAHRVRAYSKKVG